MRSILGFKLHFVIKTNEIRRDRIQFWLIFLNLLTTNTRRSQTHPNTECILVRPSSSFHFLPTFARSLNEVLKSIGVLSNIMLTIGRRPPYGSTNSWMTSSRCWRRFSSLNSSSVVRYFCYKTASKYALKHL